MSVSKFSARRLVALAGATSSLFAGAAVLPATSSAALNDCQLYGTICIWPHTDYNGYADRWDGSDPSWWTGIGTHVVNDDDSVTNQTSYWSRTFKDENYTGGCRWMVGDFTRFFTLPNNDNGESHLRSSSRPSC